MKVLFICLLLLYIMHFFSASHLIDGKVYTGTGGEEASLFAMDIFKM